MPYNLFGFIFKRHPNEENLSFAPPANDDGAVLLEHGGAYTTVLDLDGIVKNEIELITKYREMAHKAEVEGAISEIVNEAIVTERQKTPISLVTDKLNYSADIIQKIQEEFENILNLLDFNNEGQDIFRRWYIDGRLFFHIIIDPERPRDGIQELRYIDPRRIKPVVEMESFVSRDGIPMQQEQQRYYVYNQFGTDSIQATTGVKVAWDSICHVHSGIQETNNTMILGHLHKALKPSNMLTMCLVGDTLIWTDRGQVRIVDLKADDTVLSSENGKIISSRVKKQWSNGIRDVVQVKSFHHTLECTSIHPFLVVQKTRNERRTTGFTLPQWKKAEDLTNRDYIIFAGKQIHEEPVLVPKYIPTKSQLAVGINLCSFPEYVTPEFARLFGFLLGDGTVGKVNVSFAEGVHENINQRYKQLMEQFFGSCFRHNSKTRKYTRYSVSSKVAADTLRALGFLGDSHTKRLPEWIFRAAPEIRKAMIEGFCDADGYAVLVDSKNSKTLHWRLNLCQRPLLEDIKAVWTSLGLCSGHIYDYERTHPKSTLVGFDYSRTYKSHSLQISTLALPKYDKVSSVKQSKKAEVFDITIESTSDAIDAHSFIAKGIIVHNTEDATVIYRLSRAPERRIFYIDVGNLPKGKSEQYIKDIMAKYRNKMVYDANTGEVRDDKKFLSFMEDYWLPRREGGKGTEIDTLPGGENLGEMTDVEYFKEKLYQALNVPVGRLKSDSGFNIGRAAEISRDEVKFGKFIDKLRNRFSQLFDGLLSTQLMLKGIIAKDDWQAIRQKIFYDYLQDTYFSEMKNLEVIRERMSVVDLHLNYVGKYVPHRYLRQVIMKQSDQEMKQFDEQMDTEKKDPRYQALEALTGGMPPGGDMGGDMGGDAGGGMPPEEEPAVTDDDSQPGQDSMTDVGGDDQNPVSQNVEALWKR